MKKLRKISLEDFDRLSSTEASKLMGGQEAGYPYRPVTFNPPPVTKTLPITVGIKPVGGGITIPF